MKMIKKIIIIDFGFSTHLKKGDLAGSTLGCQINMSPILLWKLNSSGNYNKIEYK